MERRGFIEDDDGFMRGYEVRGNSVYRNGKVIGYVERMDDEYFAYKRTHDGTQIQIGKVYWAEDD